MRACVNEELFFTIITIIYVLLLLLYYHVSNVCTDSDDKQAIALVIIEMCPNRVRREEH